MALFCKQTSLPEYINRPPTPKPEAPLDRAVRAALNAKRFRPGMFAAVGLVGLAAAATPTLSQGGGANSVFPAVVDVNNLGPGEGFRLNGIGSGSSFGSVSDSIGDVNGDGIDDILVTAVLNGKSYVVFGSDSGFPDEFGVESLDGANGFEIRGATSFSWAQGAGDVNGDGLDDIVIGQSYGAARVVFGGATPLFRIPQSLEIVTSSATGAELHGGFIANGVTDLQVTEFGLTRGETHMLSITGATGEFSPYDQPEGVGVTLFDVPANSLQFIVDTFDSESPDVDLFVGRDDNGDGDISPDEERCNSGTATSIEHCEIDSPEAGSWWVAVINFVNSTPGATDDTSVQVTAIAPSSGSFTASGPSGPIVDVTPFSVELTWNLDAPVDGDVYRGALQLGTGPGSEGNLGIVPVTLSFDASGRVIPSDRGGDPLPPVAFDLANLDGTNGIVLNGPSLRPSPTGAGDINGDGVDDIVVATYYSGRAFAVFGSDAGLPAEISLNDLDGTNGTEFVGNLAFTDEIAAGVGDVNGDGFDDVSVLANPTYIVFGRKDFPASVDARQVDGSDGFALTGGGRRATAAGDINGDGLSDITLASPFTGSSYGSGQTFVVFGDADGFAPVVDVSSLDGSVGFTLNGAPFSYSSGSSSGAGDVNGDQVDDLAIGGSFGGDGYVVFGNVNGFAADVSLDDLDGSNGFRFDGASEGAKAAGDINADGIGDVMIAQTAVPSRLYAVFGRQAPDTDLDGIADDVDNCLERVNPGQVDSDGDLFGNACDADFDNTCIVDFDDLGYMRSVFFTADALADLTGDGAVNFLDLSVFKQLFLAAPGPSGIAGAACSER